MSLLSGLIAHWSLNEESGVRYSHNNLNNLSDNNTVTQNLGVVGMAAQFVAANSEYLSIADNADVSVPANQSFTISAWVYPDTAQTDAGVIAKRWIAVSADYSLLVVSGNFRWGMYSSANIYASPALVTGVWQLVTVDYDSVAQLVGIQINNNTKQTAAGSTGSEDGAAPFLIGTYGSADFSFNGRIDSVGIWKRVLTSAEIATLYNNGMGLEYPWDNYARNLRRNRQVGQITNTVMPINAKR